jgi:hypothetical protein
MRLARMIAEGLRSRRPKCKQQGRKEEQIGKADLQYAI